MKTINAEAHAALASLSGYVAFIDCDRPTSDKKVWIWDGERGRYYKQDGSFRDESRLSLSQFEDRLDYRPCAVPYWFRGHER